MSRFYAPKENIGEKDILIDGNEAHHILDVMRLVESDKVVVFDGTGAEYTGFIKTVDERAKRLIVEIIKMEKPLPDKMPDVTLAQSVPKKNKMDLIVEKATELGVSHMIPLVTARTIVRPDEGSSKRKEERWRKIAVEAAKQCGRTNVPEIAATVLYNDLVADLARYDVILLAYLGPDTIPLRQAIEDIGKGSILVLVGPEGDFTQDEITAALCNEHCRSVSLGPRVLKSDTAALFILSAIGCRYSI
ncbi:MAG: RsmE family RNA methyltransferase [Candidatus Omnitrophica bacterium]|nr:RsmE family RNA methyltransferase [Candidatus Omnitrophota bacterium]MDD5487951.1 RsmE family RNA methyltransferase [Candidatus Omnitrophota bacterium]